MENQNELIAEFMGASIEVWEAHERLGDNDEDAWYAYFDGNGVPVEELDYNKSWDWLMPVVDKIEAIHGVYRKGGITYGGQRHNAKDTKYLMEYGMFDKSIAHIYAQDRLSAEYNAVVEFIKFYNIDIENKKIEAFLSLTHKNK